MGVIAVLKILRNIPAHSVVVPGNTETRADCAGLLKPPGERQRFQESGHILFISVTKAEDHLVVLLSCTYKRAGAGGTWTMCTAGGKIGQGHGRV